MKNCNNKIKFMAVFIILAITAINPSHSYANESSDSDLKKKFDVAFSKMLEDPSDVDVTMNYANLAVEMEDYEAAIPALERILLFNPNLPRIKQELGVLYYRLDSLEMAKSYLEDSKKGVDVPLDVVKTANQYLSKIK